MAKGREYNGGTVVAVVDRDDASGLSTNHVEMDPDGNRWHCVKGKDAVLLRDEGEYTDALAGK